MEPAEEASSEEEWPVRGVLKKADPAEGVARGEGESCRGVKQGEKEGPEEGARPEKVEPAEEAGFEEEWPVKGACSEGRACGGVSPGERRVLQRMKQGEGGEGRRGQRRWTPLWGQSPKRGRIMQRR